MTAGAHSLEPASRGDQAGSGEGRQPAAASRPGPLWLAVYCPWLAGEVLQEGGALIVSEESPRGRVVYRASPGAGQRGVVPGMTVSAAAVLCPDLPVRRRRPRREQRRLAELAERLMRFSPVVSVDPPETVLLEVRGSLTLFRGLERLGRLVDEEVDAAGHVHRLAGAPTPAAAGCLVRWGRERIVTQAPDLRSALGALPVAGLDLDGRTIGRLARAGLYTLRDLWRLPPDGLARRFGADLVRTLDRLQGRRPDPRPMHASPLRCSTVLMLDAATDDLAQIEAGVGHLLARWVEELRRSARGTTGFTIECLGERDDETLEVDIGLRRVSRDKDHLLRLAAERLSRVRLGGPVTGLVLTSDRLHPFTGRSGRLFDGEEAGQAGGAAMSWQRSEELLAARLDRGLEALQVLAEHRPERAWRAVPADHRPGGSCPPGGRRPLWLLDPPRPLPGSSSWSPARSWPACPDGTGPAAERIESGWWDRGDQRRDYYTATDPQGRRLWVFWDLRRERWYLHGLFA